MFVFEVTSHKLVSDCNSTMRYYLIIYTYFVVPKTARKVRHVAVQARISALATRSLLPRAFMQLSFFDRTRDTLAQPIGIGTL